LERCRTFSFENSGETPTGHNNRKHYQQLEKYWLTLAQHYLLTLEDAERSYGWEARRSEPTQPPSVFKYEKDVDGHE
jgi:hypothetical protein